MKFLAALTIALAALLPTPASAAPRVGTIQFGTHMDKENLDVYPAQTRFPAGKAPFYAASFRHPVHAMHVTVALSAVFGASTELKAIEHDYMDNGTVYLMGWLPKETLRPGVYILTIRGHNTVLASGSFRVVGAHSVKPADIGPCSSCREVLPEGGEALR